MSESEVLPVEPEIFDDEDSAAPMQVHGQVITVESPLAAAFKPLILRDAEQMYEVILLRALGDSPETPKNRDGTLARSAGAFISTHVKAWIELAKIVDSNMKVNKADVHADMAKFQEWLKSDVLKNVDTDDLQKGVEELQEVMKEAHGSGTE